MSRKVVIGLILGLCVILIAGAVWMLSGVRDPVKEIERSEAGQALRGHDTFVAESNGMSVAERRTALRAQADQLTASLERANPAAAMEIQHRLLGIYGSLNDIDSAIAINKSLLKSEDLNQTTKRLYERNIVDLVVTKGLEGGPGQSKESAEVALARYKQYRSEYGSEIDSAPPSLRLSILQKEARLMSQAGDFAGIVDRFPKVLEIFKAGSGLPDVGSQYVVWANLLAVENGTTQRGKFWDLVAKNATRSLDRPQVWYWLWNQGRDIVPSEPLFNETLALLKDSKDSVYGPVLAADMTTQFLMPARNYAQIKALLTPIVQDHELNKLPAQVEPAYVEICYDQLFWALNSLNEREQAISVGSRFLSMFPKSTRRPKVEKKLYDITQ